MEKQKLAEMVMEKMRLKREQEERNRPHYEVLRLEGSFGAELNAFLKQSTGELEALLAHTRTTLASLQAHLNVSLL
jgi:ABC-type phosphate transport system auxiliary subunit